MKLNKVRQLLAQGRVGLRFADHAVIEAGKDGLVGEDLENTVTKGELLEDYGSRALLLSFTEEDRPPCHVVLGRQEQTLNTRDVGLARRLRCHTSSNEVLETYLRPLDRR